MIHLATVVVNVLLSCGSRFSDIEPGYYAQTIGPTLSNPTLSIKLFRPNFMCAKIPPLSYKKIHQLKIIFPELDFQKYLDQPPPPHPVEVCIF